MKKVARAVKCLGFSKSCRMTGGELAWREGADPHPARRAAARASLQAAGSKTEVSIVAPVPAYPYGVCTRLESQRVSFFLRVCDLDTVFNVCAGNRSLFDPQPPQGCMGGAC